MSARDRAYRLLCWLRGHRFADDFPPEARAWLGCIWCGASDASTSADRASSTGTKGDSRG